MRIACHDYNWLPYAGAHGEELDLERVLGEVADAGYEAIEFSRHPMELADPQRSRRLLEKFGLTLTGLSIFYKDAPGHWAEVLENTRVITELGAPLVVFFCNVDWAAPRKDDVPFNSTVELAEGFAEYAAGLGLDTVFHNHLRTNLETPADLDAVLPRLKRCGWCLDTGHLIAVDGDPAEYTRKYASCLRHVHFKDWLSTLADGRGDFAELGEGDHAYGLEPTLEALREVGYDGWLVLEQDRTRFTPAESARRNLTWMRAHGF